MNTTQSIGSSDGTIPCVGFGTYLLNDEQCASGVKDALDAGYKHIDTAEFYANHDGISQALKACPNLKRSDLFITDKLSPTKGASFDVFKNGDEVKIACKEHIAKLNCEYLDLYLIHHGMGGKDVRLEQWKALCDLYAEGIIRNAGVSNFSIQHLDEIKEAGMMMPSANQIEIHPLCTQTELIAYCHTNNILPIAYSSLAPASTWRIEEGQGSAKTDEHASSESKAGQLMKELVAKYSVTETQILLKWALQHQYPILPKSSQKGRIIANTDLFSFTIDSNDMHRLDNLDENSALAWPDFIGNPLNAK